MATKPRKCRTLVLGATGKVGLLLCCALRKRKSQTEIVSVARKRGDFVDHVWSVGESTQSIGPVDAIISGWGATHPPFEDNVSLARAAMALGDALGAKRVLHFSSVAVYAPKPAALFVGDPTDPPNAYGASKLKMERQILETPSKARQIILRIGNVVGADSLAPALRSGGPATLDRCDGDGPVRSYVAPGDLARLCAQLAEGHDVPGILNVAAPTPVSMGALLRAAESRIMWRDAPARNSVVMDVAPLMSQAGDVIQARSPGEMIADWRALL